MESNINLDGRQETPPAASASSSTSSRTPAAATSGVQGGGAKAGAQEHGNTNSPGTGSAAAKEDLADHAYRLDFGVAKSIRYHAKRRAWFERWHYVGSASAIISATAAFASVSGQYPEVTKWLALAFASVTATDLIMGFQRLATIHAELYKRFSGLAGELAINPELSDKDVRRWKVERLQIEADEPTNLNTLNVICHNEEAQARALGSEHRYKLNFFDRLFANWGSFRSTYSRLS